MECHRIRTKDLWEICLHRLRPEAAHRGEPILFCHGLLVNHLNFLEPAGESMAEYMADRGYDCWVMDFRNCRSAVPPFGESHADATFDGYLLGDLPAAITYIRRLTKYDKIHWVGHSFGGMMLYAYCAEFGCDAIASAATLGSPPGLTEGTYPNPRKFRKWLGALRPLSAAVLRHVVGPMLTRLRKDTLLMPINWENMHPKVDSRLARRITEIPGPAMVDALDTWIYTKSWRMKGGELDVIEGFSRLDLPLLAVFGIADPLVPIAQAEHFFKTVPSRDKQMLVLSKENGHVADYNHVDIVMGRASRDDVFVPVADWIAAHAAMPHHAHRSVFVGEGDEPHHAANEDGPQPKPASKAKAATKRKATPKTKAKPAAKTQPAAKKPAAKKAAAKKPAAKKKAPTKAKAAPKDKAKAKAKPPAKKKAASKKSDKSGR